jgi:hypothetical protein
MPAILHSVKTKSDISLDEKAAPADPDTSDAELISRGNEAIHEESNVSIKQKSHSFNYVTANSANEKKSVCTVSADRKEYYLGKQWALPRLSSGYICI